jgi:Transcriptional regulators
MSSPDAIVDTLRGRILRGLRNGTLAPGVRLPSTREVQDEFQVDHRAILAAYRMLAREGLVDVRERGGVYVALRDGGGEQHTLPAAWAAEVFVDAYRREIPIGELGGVLRRSMETLRLRAAVLSSSEEQTSRIVRELTADLGLLVEGVPLASVRHDAPVSSVLRRADLLIAPTNHADEAAAIADKLGKPWFAVELRPEFVVGEWAMLLRQPVWAIVGSAQFGALLKHAFAQVKGVDNLHILVHERDDLSVIPFGAAVYVTHRVREALEDTELNGVVLPPNRSITSASLRPILDFIVHANARATEVLRGARNERRVVADPEPTGA